MSGNEKGESAACEAVGLSYKQSSQLAEDPKWLRSPWII